MFERSEITLKACEFMRSQNGFVSYGNIEAHMELDMEEARPVITRAIKYLERDEGIVYAVVRGKGYKRLSDGEIVESLSDFTRKIGRTAGKGFLRTQTVDQPETLSNEDQMRLSIKRTVFEAVSRSVRDQA